jgi:hypothetical protein
MHGVPTNASPEYNGAMKNLCNLDAFLHKQNKNTLRFFILAKKRLKFLNWTIYSVNLAVLKFVHTARLLMPCTRVSSALHCIRAYTQTLLILN